MRRRIWAAVAGGAWALLCPAPAAAQSLLPPLLVAPSLAPLPPVPELRLQFPLRPLSKTFYQSELHGFAADLQFYRLESLWLDTPRLQLLSAASSEQALELDCRLTCQPVLQRAVDFEARLKLPALGAAVPRTWVSVRSTAISSSQSPQTGGLIRASFGGLLDF